MESGAYNILVVFMVISAVLSVVYRIIEKKGLTQTYATFIGIPLVIGAMTAYLSRPRSSLAMVMKITTLLLCIVAPALGEGVICLIMAAPIIYVVAALGYLLVEAIRNSLGPRGPGSTLVVVMLPFLLAELTSTPHSIRDPRTMTVRDERFVAAPPGVVWQTLRQGNLVSRQFPLFLQAGFPLPTKLQRQSNGLARLTFDPGSERWPGTNVIVSRELQDPANRRLTFVIQEDGTKLARWLTFVRTSFEVVPCPGGCRLRQTTVFRQRMQPGVYWNPLESFAVGQMHIYALSHIQRLAERAEAR